MYTIHGADLDSSFRDILDRFIAGDADPVHAQDLAARRAGHLEQARMLLANAAMAEPEKLAIPRDLAKSCGPQTRLHKLLNCPTVCLPKRGESPTLLHSMCI